MDQKWIIDSGVFYPIPGDTTLHLSPGPGVFQFYKNPDPRDGRLGLKRISDNFKFDFKIYDLGSEKIIDTIEKTWNSDYYVKTGRNLGVIFNGIKGTGKTISAKILCNRMKLPVVIVPYCIPGIQDFLQALEFECVILIDEAEKTFKSNTNSEMNSDEILLKLIDGVYNKARKLYILTTNKLTINENLLGRPGRIRYIQQFGNLTEKAVHEFIDDNLLYPEKKNDILKAVDLLEISTIDILRSMVDEVNIHQELPEDSVLNVPKANHIFRILRFPELEGEVLEKVRGLIVPLVKEGKLLTWLNEKREGYDGTNSDWIYDEYDGYETKLTCQFSSLWKGMRTNYGEILEEPGIDGFFTVSGSYGEPYTCVTLYKKSDPSLYRNAL